MMSLADNNLDNTANSPLYEQYESNWLSGYFTDESNDLFHLGKMSGYKRMQAKRKELNEPKWQPTTLSADMVLLRLVTENRFTRVRIDTGLEGQSDLVKLMAKEMAEREAAEAAKEEEQKEDKDNKTSTKGPSKKSKSNAAPAQDISAEDIVLQSAKKRTRKGRKHKDQEDSEGDELSDPATASSPTTGAKREKKKVPRTKFQNS